MIVYVAMVPTILTQFYTKDFRGLVTGYMVSLVLFQFFFMIDCIFNFCIRGFNDILRFNRVYLAEALIDIIILINIVLIIVFIADGVAAWDTYMIRTLALMNLFRILELLVYVNEL